MPTIKPGGFGNQILRNSRQRLMAGQERSNFVHAVSKAVFLPGKSAEKNLNNG
jgi:hypothetical protein